MFRPPNPFRSAAQKQTTRDMNTYMPPHVEQAMTEHLQNTMPAHLKKYQEGGTYVPQHAADAMQKHMESTLPPHMKQYAGAYMQQRVVRPGMVTPSANSQPEDPAQTLQTGGAEPAGFMQPSFPAPGPAVIAPTENTAQTLQTGGPEPAPGMPASAPDPDASYSFITNPAPPPTRSALEMIPGSDSPAIRVTLVAGALVFLLIIFLVFKSFLGGADKATTAVLLNVVQDQQELLHLTGAAPKRPGLSGDSLNFTANIQLSISSSQGRMIRYMSTQHMKLKVSQLSLKLSSATDHQLDAAATSGTYDPTYKEVMKSKLDTYGKDLQAAYQQEKGKKGRALLKDSYSQIGLFETQLNLPPN